MFAFTFVKDPSTPGLLGEIVRRRARKITQSFMGNQRGAGSKMGALGGIKLTRI